MKKQQTFYIHPIICIILFFQSSILFAEQCHPDDKKALLQIKQTFNDPYDYESWRPNTDCCGWFSVSCDKRAPYRITSLVLKDDTSLFGASIDDAIGDLPYLESLKLVELPYLSGSIPQSISRLKNLKNLSISYTNITGTIPSSLPESLNILDLSHNELTGSLPQSLVNIRNLQQFNVGYNQLCGQIPIGGVLNRFGASSYVHNKCLCGYPLTPCKMLENI